MILRRLQFHVPSFKSDAVTSSVLRESVMLREWLVRLPHRLLRRQLHLSMKKPKGVEVTKEGQFRLPEVLSHLDLSSIRNFGIVAHIDHGKSTLADRILELANAIPKSHDNKQVLDKLQVERERGITVKAQTCTIVHNNHLLNLIDTPGHVDFSCEVLKSLECCQAVLLLVDANKGVQAQTLANFHLAMKKGVKVIPVINKIDLPNADIEGVTEQLFTLFNFDPDEVLLVSAKSGQGVRELLDAIVQRCPMPNRHGCDKDHLRILIQDSWYDPFRGVIHQCQVFNGTLRLGDTLTSVSSGNLLTVRSMSILTPTEVAIDALRPGQVGIFTAKCRSIKDCVTGDTYQRRNEPKAEAIANLISSKSMVFANFFPLVASEHNKLRSAVEKVALNDSSATLSECSSEALGRGFRIGFLGVLHMEVFSQRLEQEFDAKVIITSPTVPYRIRVKSGSKKRLGLAPDINEVRVTTPNQWIEKMNVEEYLEPMVKGIVIAPNEYHKQVISLCIRCRGKEIEEGTEALDDQRSKWSFELPLNEILSDFFNELKQITSGYASFDYEEKGYKPSKLVKLDFLLNGNPIPELALICHNSRARSLGREMTNKMAQTLSRRSYKIAVQAVVNGKDIVARDDIKPIAKDVTAKCYGGDITRKTKLLKKYAAAKKATRESSTVGVAKTDFAKLLKR